VPRFFLTIKKNGIKVEFKEGRPGVANVVGRMSGRTIGKRRLLDRPLDVVAPGKNWSIDPFGREICNGQIYDLGAGDLKSGVTAMLVVTVGLKRPQHSFKGDVIFAMVEPVLYCGERFRA